MIQFSNFLYFELASFLSLFFLVLNIFTLRRIGSFRCRDVARSLMWSGIIIFIGLIISGAKLDWKKSVPVKEKMEIIFALDVSLSSLAKDVVLKEEGKEDRKISRLDLEKQQIKNVVGILSGDAVGLMVFADLATSLQDVLSREDYRNSLLRNLEFIDEDFVKSQVNQGTDYGNLIMASLEQFETEKSTKRLLFIITDGEPQGEENKLRENLSKALEKFSERNDINVYLIGVGNTREPSKIPKTEDDKGEPKEYYTHKNGEFILTRPNPEFLANLANATGGHYLHANSNNDLKNILLDSIEIERKIISFETKSELIDLTPYLLICSLVFLFIIPILKSV